MHGETGYNELFGIKILTLWIKDSSLLKLMPSVAQMFKTYYEREKRELSPEFVRRWRRFSRNANGLTIQLRKYCSVELAADRNMEIPYPPVKSDSLITFLLACIMSYP